MKTEALIAKATQAAQSAKVLLDTGDADGACNRAYYAMFDAAVWVVDQAEAFVGMVQSILKLQDGRQPPISQPQ